MTNRAGEMVAQMTGPGKRHFLRKNYTPKRKSNLIWDGLITRGGRDTTLGKAVRAILEKEHE